MVQCVRSSRDGVLTTAHLNFNWTWNSPSQPNSSASDFFWRIMALYKFLFVFALFVLYLWIQCKLYLTCLFLGSQAFNYAEKFGASVPTLPAAVTLCRLLSCLTSKTDMDNLRHRTSENFFSWLCGGRRGWMLDSWGFPVRARLQNDVIFLSKNNWSLLSLCFTMSLELTPLSLHQLNSDTNSSISDSSIPLPITLSLLIHHSAHP